MSKRYNTRLIHSYVSYKISDICYLYHQQSLHEQTVRKWIKKEKLDAFEYGGIYYIYGAVLKDFLKNKNIGYKRPLEQNHLKCWSCKRIGSPIGNQITKITTGLGNSLIVHGKCACGSEMIRNYSQNKVEQIRKNFIILFEVIMPLNSTLSTSTKTQNITTIKSIQSELTINAEKKDEGIKISINKLKTVCTSNPSKVTHFDSQQPDLFDYEK